MNRSECEITLEQLITDINGELAVNQSRPKPYRIV